MVSFCLMMFAKLHGLKVIKNQSDFFFFQSDLLSMLFHENRGLASPRFSPYFWGANLTLSTPDPWVNCVQHHIQQRLHPAEPSPGLSHEQRVVIVLSN